MNTPVEAEVEYQGETHDCILIRLEDDSKDVAKAWEKYLKKNHDVKMKGSDPMAAEGVNLEAVSAKMMDLFTEISTEDGITEMRVFARLGYDVYLGQEEYREQFQSLEKVTQDFLESYLPDYYLNEIDAASKVLKDMKKSRTDLVDEVSDKQSDIADNEKDIADLKKENETLQSDIRDLKILTEAKEDEMRAQQNKLDLLRKKYKESGGK